jgi:hypothetical protein
MKKTVLNQSHRRSGARMVDFGGWDMPLHYGSQIEEHHSVRRDAGMFDVSHMCAVDVAGADAGAFCNACSPTTSTSCKVPGKALYSCHAQRSRRRDRRPDRLLLTSTNPATASWSTPAPPTRIWPGWADASPRAAAVIVTPAPRRWR